MKRQKKCTQPIECKMRDDIAKEKIIKAFTNSDYEYTSREAANVLKSLIYAINNSHDRTNFRHLNLDLEKGER